MPGSRSGSGPPSGRAEVRRSAAAFIDGLLSGVERKTGWLLAEQAGLERPYRIQSLLGRTAWRADHLRDLMRAYVLEALGDTDGVLVVDETGFQKGPELGRGRTPVFRHGRADRELPDRRVPGLCEPVRTGADRPPTVPARGRAGDAARRAKAQVPADVAFATKPEIARDLIAAALDAGAPCAWVLANALYGSDTRLRRMLEKRGQPYVLAVRSNHCLRQVVDGFIEQTDPATMADGLAADAWARHAAGEGSKGLRLYDWARIRAGRRRALRALGADPPPPRGAARASPRRWLR